MSIRRGAILDYERIILSVVAAFLVVILVMPFPSVNRALTSNVQGASVAVEPVTDYAEAGDSITWAPSSDIVSKIMYGQNFTSTDCARVGQNSYLVTLSVFWPDIWGNKYYYLEFFRSADDGCTWSDPVRLLGDLDLGNVQVGICAYRNGTSDDVLVVAVNTILKSTDSGLTFTRLPDLPYEYPDFPSTYSQEWIRADIATNASWFGGQRADDDIYVVGARRMRSTESPGDVWRTSVAKSYDGGQIWKYYDVDPIRAHYDCQICSDGKSLYVVFPYFAKYQTYRSTDWGVTWSFVKDVLLTLTLPSPYLWSTHLEAVDEDRMALSYLECSSNTNLSIQYKRVGSFGYLQLSNMTYIELGRLETPKWNIFSDFRAIVGRDHVLDVMWVRLAWPKVEPKLLISVTRGVFDSDQSYLGLLRAFTNPDLHSIIRMNGVALASNHTEWVRVVPWTYTISFGWCDGWAAPESQKVTVGFGQDVVVQGNFTRMGHLSVTTHPHLPVTIYVDGIPRNDWNLSVDVLPGVYNVSFGGLANYLPPDSTTVEVVAGENTSVVGEFKSSPGQPGPDANTYGLLRVFTKPAVKTMIFLDGNWMNYFGLDWVKIPAGTHVLSFSDVDDYIAPPPMTVPTLVHWFRDIDVPFTRAGNLAVKTTPPVNATIFIDGVPRNSWGLWMDLDIINGPSSVLVSFGDVPGYLTPAAVNVTPTIVYHTLVYGEYVRI